MTLIKKEQPNAADLMPKDEASRHILLLRAKKLSERTREIHQAPSVHYIRFRLGKNEYYGIPYYGILEVIDTFLLTPIPLSKDYIAGVINHHGILLTIIDLIKFFRMKASDSTQKMALIVVRINEISIGVLVDAIEGSGKYEKEKMNVDSAARFSVDPKYIIGIPDGITTILNMGEIVQDLQLLSAKK
ncbi:MAG TPA: chemotaxis protein CheW [Gammaproteobacteria bacterium]|nr:chemotaxis protein CheW [Gammaproteobacteria bacterium]